MSYVAYADRDHEQEHHDPDTFITKYIYSQDHKVIAIQYGITAIFVGLIALGLSAMMRLQLGFPDDFAFINPEYYYQFITMHGMIIVIYLLLLPADVIGIASPRSGIAIILGALWGALMVISVEAIFWLAELISGDGGDKLLEPHRRKVTVVFLDLRGFTQFAERAEPARKTVPLDVVAPILQSLGIDLRPIPSEGRDFGDPAVRRADRGDPLHVAGRDHPLWRTVIRMGGRLAALRSRGVRARRSAARPRQTRSARAESAHRASSQRKIWFFIQNAHCVRVQRNFAEVYVSSHLAS